MISVVYKTIALFLLFVSFWFYFSNTSNGIYLYLLFFGSWYTCNSFVKQQLETKVGESIFSNSSHYAINMVKFMKYFASIISCKKHKNRKWPIQEQLIIKEIGNALTDHNEKFVTKLWSKDAFFYLYANASPQRTLVSRWRIRKHHKLICSNSSSLINRINPTEI